MNIEKEIRELKFTLRSVEAYLETLLESQAIVLKSLGRTDDPSSPSKEQWYDQLKKVYQDKRHGHSA